MGKAPGVRDRSAPELWAAARRFTSARIGLARTGGSLATEPLLEFRLAHAQARDAVHAVLDAERLRLELEAICWDGPVRLVASAAADRMTYLLRPDLGRVLAADADLGDAGGGCDLAVVVSDGLSARAAQDHAPSVLAALAPGLRGRGWIVAPPVVVRHGRVAIGDQIASRLGAAGVLVLLGERPGLSAPDGLGAYITWKPGGSSSDADRNCVSNIRPAGLAPVEAAGRIGFLLERMRACGFSGVALKDELGAVGRIG